MHAYRLSHEGGWEASAGTWQEVIGELITLIFGEVIELSALDIPRMGKSQMC
tara:strand:+ start:114 stop:269 length:156 start_codon:yes stop_codon:yes gene_type:complete